LPGATTRRPLELAVLVGLLVIVFLVVVAVIVGAVDP